MIRTRVAALAAVALAGLLALSACTEKSDAQRAEEQAAARHAGSGLRLAVADVGTLGAVVTDQDGHTLYRSDLDTAKPSRSNCDATCARSWPPVTVKDGEEIQISDVDQNLVSTVPRSDGTKQLTLSGWPLYRSVKDTKPGEANGHGASGKWFASTPQGSKAATPTETAKPDDSGGRGGY